MFALEIFITIDIVVIVIIIIYKIMSFRNVYIVEWRNKNKQNELEAKVKLN